jgi:DNA-nicking Smr family endonuclease
MFARRNPGAAGGGPAGGSAPLDLHGLHVSEALDQLEQQLYSMQQRGERRLRVVVGQGTHGKVPARLPAAVRRWLQSEGLQFTEPYAGLLEIRL